MIPLLAPLFTGPWVELGEALVCSPPAPPDAVPLAALLRDDDLLNEVLVRHERHVGATARTRRAAASVWSLAYLDCLLPPVVVAATVLHHVFPMRPAQLKIELDDDGEPEAFHIATEGAALLGCPTTERFGPLVDDHLAPLFDSVNRLTGVPRKILWGNAARRLDGIFAEVLQATQGLASVDADRSWLLDRTGHPCGASNPLFAPRRAAHQGTDAEVLLLRQCCLCYVLPGQAYCDACPLDPQYRFVRIKASAPAA